ncbi:MAG: hypothetical protein KF729_22580 [Sandaracinaceae bacterium]|nr:hypothetical protein [Sandaracinaceae bacterium]
MISSDRPGSKRATPESDELEPPARVEPPKRSYTRRRAGARTSPGADAVLAPVEPDPVPEAPGPKAPPTLIEAAVQHRREQARGLPDDRTPTIIERSLFDEEDDDLPPELAEFKAALLRSGSPSAHPPPPRIGGESREPSGPVRTAAVGLAAWTDEELAPDADAHARQGAADAALVRTKMLSPLELAVEIAGGDGPERTEAELAAPRLEALREELARPTGVDAKKRAAFWVALAAIVVLLAVAARLLLGGS